MQVLTGAKRLLLLAASVLATGCASLCAESMSDSGMQVGDTVAQHTPLEVPLNDFRAKVVSVGASSPFCFYEVAEIHQAGDAPLVIQPDQFEVTQVSHMTAPLGGVRQLSLPSWMRPSHIDMVVQMELHSETQPHVKSLNCARRFTTAVGARYPDVVEMRLAMRGNTSIQRQVDLAYLQ